MLCELKIPLMYVNCQNSTYAENEGRITKLDSYIVKSNGQLFEATISAASAINVIVIRKWSLYIFERKSTSIKYCKNTVKHHQYSFWYREQKVSPTFHKCTITNTATSTTLLDSSNQRQLLSISPKSVRVNLVIIIFGQIFLRHQ